MKNTSSKDKLKIYLRLTGIDTEHVILIDPKISPKLKSGEIGYRLGLATKITKDKNGTITGVGDNVVGIFGPLRK